MCGKYHAFLDIAGRYDKYFDKYNIVTVTISIIRILVTSSLGLFLSIVVRYRWSWFKGLMVLSILMVILLCIISVVSFVIGFKFFARLLIH